MKWFQRKLQWPPEARSIQKMTYWVYNTTNMVSIARLCGCHLCLSYITSLLSGPCVMLNYNLICSDLYNIQQKDTQYHYCSVVYKTPLLFSPVTSDNSALVWSRSGEHEAFRNWRAPRNDNAVLRHVIGVLALGTI